MGTTFSFLRSARVILDRAVARVRGTPPPVSASDVERAMEDMRTATPEELSEARDAARRALADAARDSLPEPQDT